MKLNETNIQKQPLTDKIIVVTFPNTTCCRDVSYYIEELEKTDPNHIYIAIYNDMEMTVMSDLNVFFSYLEHKLNIKISWSQNTSDRI